MTDEELGKLNYIRPRAEAVGRLLDSVLNGLMSDDSELKEDMFGGDSSRVDVQEKKWAMMGLEDPAKRAEFVAAMTKSTSEGLRSVAEAKHQQTAEQYVKVWNEQPWWWRTLHPKFKPSRHIV